MSLTKAALIPNVIKLKPTDKVSTAMATFKEQNIRSIPVVDDEGKYLGIFGLRHVLKKLLPVSVQMEDGLENLDFVREATPGIAKRLKKLYEEEVGDNLDKDISCVELGTSMWEVTRVMALHGSPVAIINQETQEFEGLVSRQTLLQHLDDTIEEIK